MKKLNTLTLALILAGTLISGSWKAATFTAIASGDWTSSATWTGGIAPGTSIDADDDIIISSGLTVSLDQDVYMNGLSVLIPGGSITVNGTLQSTNSSALYMNNGDLAGTGTLNLDRLEFSGLSSFGFTGTSTVSTFVTSNLSLTILSNTDIQDTLNLSDGTLTIGTGALLDLQSNSTVVVDNGTITTSGGIFSSVNTYHAVYIGSSKNTGVEAAGSGLTDVYVNLDDNTQSLSLTTNMTTSGTLNLQSGNLDLNGSDLILAGDFQSTGGAMIAGDAFSNLHIVANSTLSSSLEFMSGANELNDFVINYGTSGNANMNSDLTINGNLMLTNGNLEVDGNSTLTMASNSNIVINSGAIVIVNGNFDGNNSYDVTYNGGSQSTGVELSGSGVNTVQIDLDSESNNVSLSSDFTSNGTIDIQSGNFMLAGNNLVIAGDFMSSNSGSISGDASSDLTINSTSSLSDTIIFQSSTGMLNNLTVDIQDSSAVMIGSNLNVQNLNLNSGSVVIYDNSLAVMSGGMISGADQNNYVMIDGSGTLKLDVDGASSSYVMFPVGTTTSYSPAHIEFISSTTSQFMVNVTDGVFIYGTGGTNLTASKSLVDRTWNIFSSAGSSANINLKLNWMASMEVNGFDRTNAYISHYTSGNWDVDAASSAVTTSGGMYELSRTNISGLSPFAIADQAAALEVEEEEILGGVYPNPTKGLVNINLNGNSGVMVEVIDLSGKVHMNKISTGVSNETIDLSDFADGIYLLRISTEDKMVVRRIIKS